LHTNSRDEALALPSDEAVKLALRTQQIIAYETGVPEYPDPFGGSYVVEALTDRLEAEARQLIGEIDSQGGAIAAIESGWIPREITESAREYQNEVDRGKRIVVGVNKFVEEETPQPELLSIQEAAVRQQIKRLKAYKQKRNTAQVRDRLKGLQEAAKGTSNLMPYLLQCVCSQCTLGEITDALRTVFGEYHPTF